MLGKMLHGEIVILSKVYIISSSIPKAGINFFNPIRKTDQAFIPLPNVELNVIAIDDDELVFDESESYSFIESSPKSYTFSEN